MDIVTLKVDRDTRDRLKVLAAKRKMSMTALVARLVAAATREGK